MLSHKKCESWLRGEKATENKVVVVVVAASYCKWFRMKVKLWFQAVNKVLAEMFI